MLRKRRPMNSGASGSNSGSSPISKKRRIVDCAKILLDITKESADWFPPLKSALGGVNALIKHYEQFEDVKEKIRELTPQLDRFKQNIKTTTVDGDPEETKRREELASIFEHISEESERILTKNVAARFLDKGEDTKVVVGLIERLREAIVSYQVSQQQSIYSQVTHLAALFTRLLKIQEKSPVARVKLESAVTQLEKLEDSPWKKLQDERWTKLISDLRPIRDNAKGLYKRITADGYVENEGDTASVSALTEDLRNTLIEYWVEQQQAIREQNCRLIDAADLSVLRDCRRATGAGYRHGDRRGCLKGTRVAVLNEIESWAKDFNQSPVFWLNGLAGTGKSTIAQTIAESLFSEDRLGASFFCSRDFGDRSDLRFIFPTLAFQLAYKYPDFRTRLVSLLLSNPDVAHESLYRQMQNLIVEPLRATDISTVIVIDALDECKDNEPSSAILSVLGRFVEEIPRVKFFITGRPEPRIQTGFRLPLLVDSTDVFVLHDVHPSLINSDIRLFLKCELSELAQRRRLCGWPSDEHLDLLCRRAAGLFVYAVATVKFLDSSIHLPIRRLDVILELPGSTVPEGKTHFNPNTTLDSLYTSILQAAFHEHEGDPGVDSKIRTTVGTIILLVNPLPPPAIAELMGLDPEEVMLFLTSIQSLLLLDDDSDQPVKPFHKSFPDFITEPSRCTNPRFCISPETLHLELLTNCLRVMNEGLQYNLLSLPEYALNSDVEDLQTRTDDRISIALRYSCRFWCNHLLETVGYRADATYDVLIFLEAKFLEWLEVLSALGEVGGAVTTLDKLIHWSQEHCGDTRLLHTARDCFLFVTKFFEPINVSAMHIYHTALPLCPTSSIVRRLYYSKYKSVTHIPRVMTGVPDLWEPTASISNKHHGYESCTWSPCGRFIAALAGNVVEIRNKLTFELLTVLQPADTTERLTTPLAYSPDGRSLACASDAVIIIWDIQTGGVAKEVECAAKSVSLAWSFDGETICVIQSCQEAFPGVHVYDITSGTTQVVSWFQRGRREPCLFAYGESFLVVTEMVDEPCYEFEVFGVEPTRATVHTLKIPEEYIPYQPSSFCPITCQIAISTDKGFYIYPLPGLRAGEGPQPGLRAGEGPLLASCFSSDGSLFAAFTGTSLRVFRNDPGFLGPWKTVQIDDMDDLSLQFSPAAASILGRSGNILRVWNLLECPSEPQNPSPLRAGLSRSGNYVVSAHGFGMAITITTSHTSTTFQGLARGVVIDGLALTGNVLLVKSRVEVTAPLLTEEGPASEVSGRVNYYPHIWTIALSPECWESLSFSVEGHMGIITSDAWSRAYNTETGQLLYHAVQSPSRCWYQLGDVLCGRHYLHLHSLSQCNVTSKGGWTISRETSREEWVKDSEGRRILWLPVEWRMMSWDQADWRPDITTQFSIARGQPVIIKF